MQQGLNPQANPYTDMFRSVANGALMNGFGGMQALQAGTGWVNPGIGATVDAAKTINNDAGNALMQNGLNGKNVATGLAAQAAVNAFDNPGTAAFAGQQGYSNSSLGQAKALSNVAGYNPAQAGFASQTGYTNSALGGQQALTGYLAGNNNPATSMLSSTANGDYLNSNPYINTAIKNANQNLLISSTTRLRRVWTAPWPQQVVWAATHTPAAATAWRRPWPTPWPPTAVT